MNDRYRLILAAIYLGNETSLQGMLDLLLDKKSSALNQLKASLKEDHEIKDWIEHLKNPTNFIQVAMDLIPTLVSENNLKELNTLDPEYSARMNLFLACICNRDRIAEIKILHALLFFYRIDRNCENNLSASAAKELANEDRKLLTLLNPTYLKTQFDAASLITLTQQILYYLSPKNFAADEDRIHIQGLDERDKRFIFSSEKNKHTNDNQSRNILKPEEIEMASMILDISTSTLNTESVNTTSIADYLNNSFPLLTIKRTPAEVAADLKQHTPQYPPPTPRIKTIEQKPHSKSKRCGCFSWLFFTKSKPLSRDSSNDFLLKNSANRA